MISMHSMVPNETLNLYFSSISAMLSLFESETYRGHASIFRKSMNSKIGVVLFLSRTASRMNSRKFCNPDLLSLMTASCDLSIVNLVGNPGKLREYLLWRSW